VRTIVLRPALAADFPAVCALNHAEVRHTSPMDVGRLAFLDGIAYRHTLAAVDDEVAAFVLALRDGAPYENDNFRWFARRYPRFVYVDRVVVAARHRGLALGTRLYADLFADARAGGFPVVTCEYNLEPPNEPSARFHQRFGFREVGTQWVGDGSKRVSLQVAAT
jgi:predicted GNAT superfamily acetyltransferase